MLPAGTAPRERLALDAAQQFEDATVFEKGAVVEEAPQLLRKPRDGALRVLAGLEPVVVDAARARIGR
mgnify:CR=1 FL=1